MRTKQSLFLIMVTLLIVSLACSLAGGDTPAEEAPAADVEKPAAEDTEAEEPAEETTAEETDAEDTDAEEADAEETEAEAPADEAQDYDTEFPLPEDVQNFMGGEGTANFATSLTVEEAIEFYRGALADMGLTERTLNTAITETTFSMVFDGHENGKAVVVQGVDLGNGTTNINIRFEDV